MIATFAVGLWNAAQMWASPLPWRRSKRGPILSASVMPLSVKFPPSLYKQLIFPHQKRLIEAIQGAGALVRLHICGNISKHLPVLKNLHVDILDLDWPVDLTYARSVMGDTVLVSNSNPVADIQQGTMAQIEEQIEAMYVTAGNPFLIGGRAAKYPLGTPEENLEALCAPVLYRRDNE